jgi:diamine N-acetyltransferase
VEAVCEEVRRRGHDRVVTTWEPGEEGPEQFYLGLRVRPTGETSGGQVVGARLLSTD